MSSFGNQMINIDYLYEKLQLQLALCKIMNEEMFQLLPKFFTRKGIQQ